MGWSGTHRDRGQALREFMKYEFTGDIVDMATVNRNTCYVLLRTEERVNFGFRVPSKLKCIVVLLRYAPKSYYNIYLKSIDEDCGPYETQCPERILKQLPPPDSQYSWEWRQKCWKNVNRRKSVPSFQVGDVLEFKSPMIFTDHVERGRFTVSKVKPLRFVDDCGYWVRLRQELVRNTDLYKYLPKIS